jgi:uncharacterized SAM-binding protein YcdF (DUF218 family)
MKTNEPHTLIITFGAGMDGAKAGLSSAARATAAAVLFHQHPGSTILLSGAKTRDQQLSEAQAMKDVIMRSKDFSVPPDHIFIEDDSFDTASTVRNCVRMIRNDPALSADRLILVSGWRNLARAVRYFRAQGRNVEAHRTKEILEPLFDRFPEFRGVDATPPSSRDRMLEKIHRVIELVDPTGRIVSMIARRIRH